MVVAVVLKGGQTRWKIKEGLKDLMPKHEAKFAWKRKETENANVCYPLQSYLFTEYQNSWVFIFWICQKSNISQLKSELATVFVASIYYGSRRRGGLIRNAQA